MKQERRKSGMLKTILYVAVVVIIAVIGIAVMMETAFVINTIDVEGCTYSDPDEITAQIQSDAYSDNSLLLYLQLSTGRVPDVDFVESIKVTFIAPWHICLQVTEKSLYGVVYDSQNLTYIYFDSSGIVAAVSETEISQITPVAGTVSGDATVGAGLNLIPEGSSEYVIEVFALIDDYGLETDQLTVDEDGEISFITSGMTIVLGDNENTAEKFKNLSAILEQLTGMSGTLDLSDFEETGDDIIFTQE